jgi:hypothetical protein
MIAFLSTLLIAILFAVGSMEPIISTSIPESAVVVDNASSSGGDNESELQLRHDELRITLDNLVYQFGGSEFSNAKATLAWHHTYLIRGMILWQQLYPDDSLMIDSLLHVWLRKLIDSQDSNTGREDYMGLSAPGWSCAQYSDNGENCRFILQTGIIGAAMLEAVATFSPTDPLRRETLDEIGMMIEFYETEWYRADLERYEFAEEFPESRIHKIQGIPINHEAAWIECLYRYKQLTDSGVCKLPIDRFIKRLEIQAEVKWTYFWTVMGHQNRDTPEDVRHGALVLGVVDLLGWERFPMFKKSAQDGAAYLSKSYLEQGVVSRRVSEYLEGSHFDYVAILTGWNTLPDTKDLLQPLTERGWQECIESGNKRNALEFLAMLTALAYSD